MSSTPVSDAITTSPPLVTGVARGTQAVAVEHGADLAPVGKCDRSRSVPRLHHAGMELVEGALGVAHRFVVLPRLGDHHHDRVRQRAPGPDQQFQGVVEHRGVAAGGLDDRQQLLDVVAEQRRGEQLLARVHPVDIAAQRVDFAVVAQEAVGMGAVPARESVGGETLMDHRQRAGQGRIEQVGKELRNLGGD